MAHKIFNILKTLAFATGFALIIAIFFLVERNKKRKGLSVSKYFSDADTTDLTYEELQQLTCTLIISYGRYFYMLNFNWLNSFLFYHKLFCKILIS